LDAEQAPAPPRSDAGRRALAAITSGAAQLAPVNFQPLPSSVVTLSGTQIAKIEG
jgi:hypothetical protein